MEMFLLSCLLLRMVLAIEREVDIHNYIRKINNNTLNNIEPIDNSTPELNLSGLGLHRISPVVIHSDVFQKTSYPKKDQSHQSKNLWNDRSINRRSAGYEKFSISVCKDKSKLKLVKVSNSSERNCSLHTYDPRPIFLLRGIGIETFEKGWYQVQDLPIHVISLPNNNITRVISEMLNDLPSGITIVSLESNNIARLEKGLIKNEHITALRVTYNNISEIEDGAFANTKIQHLFLQYNSLKNTKFAETLPTSLKTLELGNNKITEISSGSFSKLNQLNTLDLSQNHITEICAQSLRGLSSLAYLELQSNAIYRIEASSFQDLDSLERVNLNLNSIGSTEMEAFADLKNIKTLLLGSNNITTLTKDSMIGWSDTLEHLYLGYNRIEKLEAGTFVNVPKILLSLDNNHISKIEKGSFNLPSLEGFYLKKNRLRVIDQDMFQGLGNLRRLLLNFNAITTIEEGSFRNMGRLCFLSILGNPIDNLENKVLYDFGRAENCF